MSCQCRLQCEQRFGGVLRRHAEICWDFDETTDEGRKAASRSALNTSDFPESMDGVAFHAPNWPFYGKCAIKPSARCGQPKRQLHRVIKILGGTPLPNRRCPRACSHRGTCLEPLADRSTAVAERYPLSSTAKGAVAACICHKGYAGASCELEDTSQCFNQCSGSGRCVGRFCLCDHGRYGVDCSLPRPLPRPQHQRRKYVPTYIYPLPTDWSLEYVYQRDSLRRGQYYANLIYMEELLRRKDAVDDPEQVRSESRKPLSAHMIRCKVWAVSTAFPSDAPSRLAPQAALFFVPVMVMQMAGNLWHPYEFLGKTVELLRHSYPYWNRSAGTDHIFFLTTDRAGCWKPWALQHSLIVTYLGFPAAEAYFGFEERLRWPPRGPQTHNNAYSIRKGAESLGLACYVPEKDVVVPVWRATLARW